MHYQQPSPNAFYIRAFPLSHSFGLENWVRIERTPRTALVAGGCIALLYCHTSILTFLFASFSSALLRLSAYLGTLLLELAEYRHLNNLIVSLPQQTHQRFQSRYVHPRSDKVDMDRHAIKQGAMFLVPSMIRYICTWRWLRHLLICCGVISNFGM